MKVDIEAAQTLLQKLERADGPSWEIDRALGFMLAGWRTSSVYSGMIVDHHSDSGPDSAGGIHPSPTESVDTAIEFIRLVLPEAAWGVSVESPTPDPSGVKYHAFVGDHFPHFNALPGKWWGEADYAAGAALALCIAMLKAVTSKAEAST